MIICFLYSNNVRGVEKRRKKKRTSDDDGGGDDDGGDDDDDVNWFYKIIDFASFTLNSSQCKSKYM